MLKKKYLVHSHIFKNAGTSLHHFLKKILGSRNVLDIESLSKNYFNRSISSHEAKSIMKDNAHIICFTGHHLPIIPDEEFINIIPLREPIKRSLSVYEYELIQGKKGFKNLGPVNAVKLSPKEYFLWRLGLSKGYDQNGIRSNMQPKNSVISNYQTAFILGYKDYKNIDLIDDHFLMSKELISKFCTPFIIEKMTSSIALLLNSLNDFEIRKDINFPFANVNNNLKDKNYEEELKSLIGGEVFEILVERNKYDYLIHSFVGTKLN
jgi:hypothetical protein